ncbi:MAG: 30S ribosomal protein S5 [Candidatus Magasanikiibacteriota bacterium]
MAYKGKGKPGQKPKKEKPEFDQQIVDLARVTRVTKGGKQLSFRATVVIGDRKGRVGYGVDKGKDVQMAVEKAVNQAKKNVITVPMNADSIPHTVQAKYKAAKVFIKPAPKGSGIIAGGSIRVVLELAGIPNASAKMIGRTNNKISNVKATFDCLQMFKKNSFSKKVEPVVAKLDAGVNPVDESKKEVVQKAKKDNDKQ